MIVVLLYLQLAIALGNEVFQLKEDCQWNYTLKNEGHQNVFKVEMEDLGNANSSDCQGLYEDVPPYGMKNGRHDITVGLEKTKDPQLQDIKVSWKSGDDILRYLLVLELKERYDGYTIKDENTRCISVTVIPTRDGVQGLHHLVFDCIQVPTGTMQAVLQTAVRVQNPKIRKCRRKQTCFEFIDPVQLATNINADCCQRRVYSSEVKLRTENFCRWVISVKREGFSSWTYELRGSNTAHVSKGKLLPISGLQTDAVVARVVNFEKPAVYVLEVSFWCSFHPVNMSADQICTTVTKKMDATLCDISRGSKILDEHTEKLVVDQQPSKPLFIVVVILASVALGMIATAVVVFATRKRACYCCQRSYGRHQNNFQTNDVNDAFIKDGIAAPKMRESKKECDSIWELMEKLPV